MKKKKPTTFLNDPEVGHLYQKDALDKYADMTVEEMLFKLACECGERVMPSGPDRFTVLEERPDGNVIVKCNIDETMYRIYHTLETILDKMREEKKEEAE